MKKRHPLPKAYEALSNEQLMLMFNNICTMPEYRVKRTGLIRLSAAKFGDRILDLVNSRTQEG